MTVEFQVDWEARGYEEVTVIADVLKTKVVDAPAAITVIEDTQIATEASTGQVPKILEFTPGAEVTQSGLYDFNFNTRGFNSSLNRRVSTYIDGRDVGVVLLGAQEWAAIAGRPRRRGQAGVHPRTERGPLRRQRLQRCREHHDEGAAR
jgi:hypothetical protein